MELVIAEKPSVALSIAKVIGAKNKKDGYYEGNGYRVSWCVGHLIQMANPDSYDEKYAKWNIDDLPIIPSEYQYDVAKATKKQFNTLKKLMNDKGIDTVINACDAGREGEAIFRLVYLQASCKKKMKRLWISSMEDSAIKDGFDKLKDGKDYDNLFESAQARAVADWLVGMNISRLYSCLYKQNYSVGRVQTPTLAMIVKRDDEITNFKKDKYYTVELSMNGFILSTERIDDEVAAEQLINLVGDKIEITDVIQKEKITKPDLPFDLTTLQRECNKYFGYSAKQTLDYAQSLYEKKLITYPRTDSRCLTEDMITSTVNNILGKNDFDTGRIKTVFNSKKVTDHHAIIPTVSSLSEDLSGIPESEAKVYRLISNKLHARVDASRIARQRRQQFELRRREIDLLALDKHLVTRDINHEVTKVKNLELRLGLGVGTTQQGAHAGDELARREGLDEVVICPQFEADDAILDLALGGEHDDGHVRGLANRAAHTLARELGKHEVQHDEVKAVLLELLQRALPITHPTHDVAFALEIRRHCVANRLFVLNQENLLLFGCHESPLLSCCGPYGTQNTANLYTY